MFGFLGPNGAGKTTTLKLLMQLIYPTSGTAEILGLPVGSAAVKRRIGYLPENPYFYDHLTAEELLEYFASLFGYAGAERRHARVARCSTRSASAPSGGCSCASSRRACCSASASPRRCVNDPEVVFFDEPMSGLDPLGRREIRQLILRLRERGCTVFFSSHVLADAEALCSRVAIVARGRLVASGALSDILAFKVHGWELVVSHLTPAALECARKSGRVEKAMPLGEDRYALDLPLSVAAGASCSASSPPPARSSCR